MDLGSSMLVCHRENELNTPGIISWLKVCSSFGYQFYPSFSFNIVLWEPMSHDWSHIWGYYRFVWVSAIVITCSHTASIVSHLHALLYCLFLLRKFKKSIYSESWYTKSIGINLWKIYFENIQRTRLLDDEVTQRVEEFMSFCHFFKQ